MKFSSIILSATFLFSVNAKAEIVHRMIDAGDGCGIVDVIMPSLDYRLEHMTPQEIIDVNLKNLIRSKNTVYPDYIDLCGVKAVELGDIQEINNLSKGFLHSIYSRDQQQ